MARNGGLFDVGDANVAALAIPVAVGGLFALLALSAGVAFSGYAYTFIVRQEVSLGNPLHWARRSRFFVFLGVPICWTIFLAIIQFKGTFVFTMGFAIVALLAMTLISFGLESWQLCERAWPTRTWVFWRSALAGFAALVAGIWYGFPVLYLFFFGASAIKRDPHEDGVGKLLLIVLFGIVTMLVNYLVSLGGWRPVFGAIMLVAVTFFEFAPDAIVNAPFKMFGLADYYAILTPISTATQTFKLVSSRCPKDASLLDGDELKVHVRTNVASSFVIVCADGLQRIRKSDVAGIFTGANIPDFPAPMSRARIPSVKIKPLTRKKPGRPGRPTH